MELTVEETTEISPEAIEAMQRGLDAIGRPGAEVVVAGDFVGIVERLDGSGPYTATRGMGVVAAKTICRAGRSIIVVNGRAMHTRAPADIERLLAHEGGHVALHDAGEAAAEPITLATRYFEGLAFLNGAASTAIDEFRIENRLAELGYPLAERAELQSVDDQLLELSCDIFEGLIDPASADTRTFAKKILEPTHRFTVTLSYLAAQVVAGTHTFTNSQLPAFAQRCWEELIEPSWTRRLRLYEQIPPVGTSYDRALRITHAGESVRVERHLLHDLGFEIRDNNDPDGTWYFLRTGSDEMFDARLSSLTAELDRRDAA